MQHFRIGFIGLAALAAFALAACAGGGKWQGGSQDEDVRGKLMAERDVLASKGVISTVSTATSADLQLAINKVELECRAQMARALEAKVETMQKSFADETEGELLSTFSTVTKGVASTVVRGTVLKESPYRKLKDGKYEAHGLMVLDAKLFRDAMAQQMAADKALETRWRSSKAYEELDKEVEAFEAYKREQAR